MIGNYLVLAGCAIAIILGVFALGFGLVVMWREEAWGLVLFLAAALAGVFLLVLGGLLSAGGI